MLDHVHYINFNVLECIGNFVTKGIAMKRVARQPTRLGVMDLAAEIGQELDLPLDRISEKFSFDDAAKIGMADKRLLIGRRAEKMFEYVVASLGKAELIHQEDASAPLYAGEDVQAPDYFVALKSGERYFVEVKHTRINALHTPLSFSKNYLSRLKRYAYLKGHPLTIAVYWQAYRQWTINKVQDFETKNGTLNLRFIEALQKSIASDFGDRMIGVVPPLVCRLHAKKDCPSSIDANNFAKFTIGNITFFSEGNEIISDIEKQIAFYMMFHSSWDDPNPTVMMDEDRIEYVEFVTEPSERTTGQNFEIIGTTAGMVSKYFDWLTTADEGIVRLVPAIPPEKMAPGFDESYKSDVLHIWQFHMEPNYDSLK